MRVSESVVDPSTQRVYSLAIIEKALDQVGFSVDASKNAKSQVLAAIKMLQQKSELPIQRARMRVRVTVPVSGLEKVEDRLREGAAVVEDAGKHGDFWEAVSCFQSIVIEADADDAL